MMNGTLNGFNTASRRFSKSMNKSSPEPRVLVLYTGGTIGMVRNDEGSLAPIKGEFEKQIRKYPQLHDSKYSSNTMIVDDTFLCLPVLSHESVRTLYKIKEYDKLLDSANMSVVEWIQIATDIKENYELYDGFVILHGTDTMAYTASALSFMFENLGKSIVITGSQIPIFEPRTDGTDNFVSALIVASKAIVPEVTVFFGCKLFRGNRTTKLSADAFYAFISPNCPPLADSGINLQFNERLVFRPRLIEKFRVHTSLSENVGLLRIFPSITASTVRAFLQPPTKGVIMQTYGAGNIPADRQDLLTAIKNAADAGILIVNITQCFQGSVAPIYATGKLLTDLGVICGFDMTIEAALTKLAYVLSKTDCTLKKQKEMMVTSLRGELTSVDGAEIKSVLSLGRSSSNDVSWLLDSSTKDIQEETDKMCNVIFPTLLNYALDRKDTKKIKHLIDSGADVCGTDVAGRTPLHHVASEGNSDMIEFLMKLGASVHIKDRYGNTPLMDAILNDNHDAISLLVECGSHLTAADHPRVTEDLCLAAATGNLIRIDSHILAGADLNNTDTTGRTPLHMAALNGKLDIVNFLLKHGANPDIKDVLDMTAVQCAKKTYHKDIVQILNDVIRR